jgi:hypothetical protein
MHTDIHALSGIRTHDRSIRATEEVHALERVATVIGHPTLFSLDTEKRR